MPTAENTEAACGRVTRSRKRLTSIDGESSSRPGTPVNINLQTISETNTPLKRITRRASLSTPAPTTPSKTKSTLDNVELSNTPGRRPTRRRSVNITSDVEEHAGPIVSKEPTISVVKEEEPQLEVETSKGKPVRITRSSSKSPRDNETGAKKNSKQSNKKANADESLEVINLDDSVDEVVPLKSNTGDSKKPKVLLKKEKEMDETPKNIQQIKNESTPTKKPTKLSTPRKIPSKQIPVIVEEPTNSDNNNQSSENIKERKRSSGVGFSTPTKSPTKKTLSPKPISTEQSQSDKGSSKKSESAKKKKLNSEGDDKPEASQDDSRKGNRSKIVENKSPTNTTDVYIYSENDDDESNSHKKQLNTSKKNDSVQNLGSSMKRISLSSPKKRQSLEKEIQQSPLKKNNRPEQLKNVAFNDTADENTIKSVYPKTPGLTKSKSYILDSSKDVGQDSSFISKTVQSFEDENAKKSDKDLAVDEEEHEGLSTKTPYKLKLKSVESSTPIQGSSPKSNKTSEVKEQNEKPVKGNLQAEEEGVFSFPTSWCPTVSGKASESLKIDRIAPQKQELKNAEEQVIDKSGSISSQSSKQKSNRQETDDSEAEDDMREEDDDEYFDDEEEEEQNREKTIFLDDEAMEVPDGEESMDSEEREYLEQNEAPVYAESLGSQDSEDDDGYDDDEADEEDAAFIISDTEVVQEELEDEDLDNLEAQCEVKSKQKLYKRIRKVSDSSSEEKSNHPSNKDDTDFCLLVDSSLEENKSHGDVDEFPTKTEKNTSASKEIDDKNVSRKSIANKSIEDKSTKDKSLKESSRLEKSQLNQTVEDTKVSETEGKLKSPSKTATNTSRRRRTFQSKSDISESDSDDSEDQQQKQGNVLKSPSKKELAESPKRKSITKPILDESEDESSHNKSTKGSRNSMNHDDVSDMKMEENECNTKSPSKTATNTSRRKRTFQSKSDISESDSDDSEDQKKEQRNVLKSPSKKELAKSPKRKSITKPIVDESEDESSQNKSTKGSRNSMNNDDVSDTKMEKNKCNTKSPSKSPSSKSRKLSTFQNKSDISESDSDSEDKVLKSPPKKELPKSPKRKSIANAVQNESEDESSQNKSTKPSRNSMNNSKARDDVSVQEEASDTEIAENGGNAKSPTQAPTRARRMSTFQSKPNIPESDDNSENQEEELNVVKSPVKNSPRRKSISNPVQDKSEDESSQNKSTQDARNSLKRKPLVRTSTEETEESKESPKKLNTSRKSLVRTSTEDADDTGEQNKTIMSVDSESEPEESLPVSEIPKDASPGWTLNSSEKTIKSLGEEQEESKNKPAQRRKSISQKVITNENVSESSCSEDEEEREEKTSAEITDDEMETSRNEPNEAQFSDEEVNVATDGTMLDFLGEEDKPSKANSSRRKSVAVVNESKLDETFQMDPKNSLSSSMHDSLHRSILRKSFNQSQLRRETNRTNIDEEKNAASSDSEEGESSEEEEVKINKKVVCEKGLSVSLNSIQIKKKKLKDAKAIRNSFTIGVSVRKNTSEVADSSCVRNWEETLSQHEVPSEDEEASSSSPSSSESDQVILSEEEDLEKVKDVQRVGPYNKSRKSMSSSFLLAPPAPSESDVKQKKQIKRTSLYLQEEAASSSFVENLAEEKKKIKLQKRKSNSFCGTPADDENAIQVPEPRSEKRLKKTSESDEKEDKEKKNIHHILSRCDEIMERANLAKREAKLNAKKVKVKKPKWANKNEEEAPKEDDEVKIPLVSKKEIKRKEKMKKELAKAVKQSIAVLSKIVQPPTKADQKSVPEKLESNKISSSKRLETEFLESLVELSHPKKKKANKEMDTTPPSDKENSKKTSNKSKSKQTFKDVHEKTKPKIETLETVCGTVIVEPSTPQKLRNQNGFRESPKTPKGFKIQDISSAKAKAATQKSQKIAARKLLTASGSFIEEDQSKSNSKRKTRKRKLLNIEEPTYSLPKTQWTPSGVFVEEDLFSARPLANSTATQFLVTSLNNGKANKSSSKVVSSTTLNSALSFKQSALRSNKVPRQDSREILHRKQRKATNKQF